MEHACRNGRLDENIREMPLKLTTRMRDILDSSRTVNGWQMFITLLDKTEFKLSQNDIDACSDYIAHRSPTDIIITKLINKNFLIRDLLRILNGLQQESLVEDVRNYVGLFPEPVRISQQPVGNIKIEAGENLELKVEAQGFPYPRYQWFFEDDIIPGENTCKLIKKNVRVEDSGWYCCRLHNSPDPDEVIFTQPSEIIVRQSPVPVILQHTQSHTLFAMDTLMLTCTACACVDSPLVYEWYKDDVFFALGPNHQKKKLGKNDSGEYKCFVKNDFGVVVTEPILINVLIETLEIVVQPKSSTVEFGKIVLLECKAHGPQPLSYQWYKDDICIPGARSGEYFINVESPCDTGIYFCKVSCPNFQMECDSEFAILQIKSNLHQGQKKYFATDKVALLIGNEDYRSERKLTAPQNDVKILSQIFKSLNFKVLSLVNLTLNEMESAIMKFVEMLDKGVYGVFYYAGHGFEVNGDPYSYLTPVDAPTGCNIKSCLQAEKIQELMVSKKPAICCLILDICRTIQQSNMHQSRPIKAPENSVYFYATSRGKYAYENTREKMGLLVKHLCKFLYLEEGIEKIFGKVRGDIANTNSEYKQVPEMKTNLTEVDRSLTDSINCTNHTVEFKQRVIAWGEAHQLPESQKHFIPSINMEFKVDFQQKFSNVLIIYVTIINPGNATNCHAWAAKFPSVLSADKPLMIPNENKTEVVIRDLQKLKDAMEVVIKIVYEEGMTQGQKSLEYRIKLGYPLVAKQQLWKKCTVFRQNEPTEQEECIESLDHISLE